MPTNEASSGRRALLAGALVCVLAWLSSVTPPVSGVFRGTAQVDANTFATRGSFGLEQLAGTSGCTSEDGTSGTCVDGTALREPAGVAVTSDGAFVYSATYVSDGVAAFSRDTSTGVLTQLSGTNGCITNSATTGCTTGKALDGAWGIAISPDDKHVYAAAFNSGAVAVFSRNTSTGVLTQLSGTNGCVSETGTSGNCATVGTLGGADGVAVSPDGNHVYVAAYNDDAVVAFSRNTTTGVLTQLSGTNGCVSNTGSGGACATGKALNGTVQLTVSPDNASVYAASDADDAVAVFSRNTSTGALTQLSGTSGCISHTGSSGNCVQGTTLDGAYDVTVSPDDTNVYVTAATSAAVNVYARDTGTGALTRLSGTAGCTSDTGNSGTCVDGVALTNTHGVVVSPNGEDVYVGVFGSDAVAVFRRNTSTGALTQWSGTRACISNSGTSGECVTGRGLDGVHRLAASPDGKHVYTGGTGTTSTGYVSAFRR